MIIQDDTLKSLHNKRIIVGVTGSIAAYKSAFLIRLLIKSGAEVKVVMTPAGCEFITPVTLSTLSKNPVLIDFSKDGTWSNHVEWALWADAMVIAPVTATTIGKMVSGIADNMLLATYLSAKCPVFIAPAMDLDMWKHPSTKRNLKLLAEDGVEQIPIGNGELASGLIGEGRMAEPEDILSFLIRKMNVAKDLTGKKILITAGPTYESIDPVRYIGNRSTGTMGIALTQECIERGAEVILVLGPSSIKIPDSENLETIRVENAAEMYRHCIEKYDQCDVAIMAAAVADYTPETVSDTKIKKSDDDMVLRLKRTADIAATLGKKKKNQILVGFALETNDEILNAKRKLQKKNLDFIVLNSLNDKGAGFGSHTNKISIIDQYEKKDFDKKPKTAVAKDIVDEIVDRLNK